MSSIIAVFGILFALFLPGLFITLIFFREVKLLERIVLSIAFSIMISVAIGIGLGYNADVAEITGGINPANVWKWELIVTSVLGVVALALNWKSFVGFDYKSYVKKIPKKKEVKKTFRKL